MFSIYTSVVGFWTGIFLLTLSLIMSIIIYLSVGKSPENEKVNKECVAWIFAISIFMILLCVPNYLKWIYEWNL